MPPPKPMPSGSNEYIPDMGRDGIEALIKLVSAES